MSSFFGLRFCVEPTRAQLAALNSGDGKKRAPTKSISALPVSRAVITPTFFATRENIPHLPHFGHLLAILAGYAVGVLFEDMASCVFPSMFSDSHVWWLAIFCVAFAVTESMRVCTELDSPSAPLIAALIAALLSLAAIAHGDLLHLANFDIAFDAFTRSALALLESRLHLRDSANLAARLALLAQLSTAAVAAALVAAAYFPATRFASLDFSMLLAQRAPRIDPWTLPPRRRFAIVLVALDYLLPSIALVLWYYNRASSTTLALLFIASILRLTIARFRLQLHLDTALDHFRAFWTERAVIGIVPAGDRLRYFVANNAYELTTIGISAIVSPISTIALALAVKRNGGLRLGLCPFPAVSTPTDSQIFVREILGFLLCVNVAAYLVFAAATVVALIVESVLDRRRLSKLDTKTVRPLSNSERRKQRRMMAHSVAKRT